MSRVYGVPFGRVSRVLDNYNVGAAIATRPRKWLGKLNRRENTAALAVRLGEQGGTIDRARSRYAAQIRANVRDIPLAPGTFLGSHGPSLGSFDWGSVANTFVGEIGKGIGRKIAPERAPAAAAPKPAFPLVPVVAGLGALGIGYLLLRKK